MSSTQTPVEKKTAALSVEGLVAGYGNKTVIHGLTFDLTDGETLVVLGANGAGKTTSLKAIVGAVEVTAGSVLIEGEPASTAEPALNLKKGLALVPEGGRVFADFTVERNLRLGAYSVLRKPDYIDQMDFVYQVFPRLKERRRQLGGTLSGGERQMLALGRTLMAQPRVLLMDEPFLGLAPIVIDRIIEAVESIRKETGVSMVVVEQSARALELADEVMVMRLGEIVVKERNVEELSTTEGMLRLEEAFLA